MATPIELNKLMRIVDCPRTDKREVITIESCHQCNLFVEVANDKKGSPQIVCLQPRAFKIFTVGELPKKEGDE